MSTAGTEQNPWRVAVIGAGPAGFYAADYFFKQKDIFVNVDMYDRLPTPHGLVRAAEIEQELGSSVTFVPHLVPLDRGLLETIYASLRPGTTEAQVTDVLQRAYASAPFVRLTGSELPEIKHVAYSNFCDIGWRIDETGGRLVIVAALDNLIKGAAGQAVQNLNIMLGLDERTGLL